MSDEKEEFRHPIEDTFFFFRFMVFWITPLIKLARKRQILPSDVWDTPKHVNVIQSSARFQVSWQKELELSKKEKRNPSLLKALVSCFWAMLLLSGALQLLFVGFQIGQPFLIGQIVLYIHNGNGGIERGVGLALSLGTISLCSSVCITTVFYIMRVVGGQIKAALNMSIYEQSLSITAAAKQANSVGQTTNLASIDCEKVFLACQFPHFLWQGPLTCLIIMCILITEVGVGPALAGMGVILFLVPTQNFLAAKIGMARRSMIQHTDERVKLINEMLQYIRIIKYYAWEVPMEERIAAARAKELGDLTRYHDLNSGLREFLFVLQPIVVLTIYLTSLYGFNRPLSQVQVIKVISFLSITRFPLNLLGVSLKLLKDGSVSIERLQAFLLLPTLDRRRRGAKELAASPGIEIRGAVLSWNEAREDWSSPSSPISPSSSSSSSSEGGKETEVAKGSGKAYQKVSSSDHETEVDKRSEMALRHSKSSSASKSSKFAFSLQVPLFKTTRSNELIAVVGSVGSGKSSLLSAILGEMPLRLGEEEDKGQQGEQEKQGKIGAAAGAEAGETSEGGGEGGRLGTVRVEGPISYCAQTPWIQNMSLRDNVLFGVTLTDSNPAAQEAYQHAIAAACLLPDLRILPGGDETESEHCK
jgi:ATP-binding cassette, subfamily C (CFTR/MRP), member 1